MEIIKEISITSIEGLRIGSAQNDEAKTGVTVLLFDWGARVGADISGGLRQAVIQLGNLMQGPAV